MAPSSCCKLHDCHASAGLFLLKSTYKFIPSHSFRPCHAILTSQAKRLELYNFGRTSLRLLALGIQLAFLDSRLFAKSPVHSGKSTLWLYPKTLLKFHHSLMVQPLTHRKTTLELSLVVLFSEMTHILGKLTHIGKMRGGKMRVGEMRWRTIRMATYITMTTQYGQVVVYSGL